MFCAATYEYLVLVCGKFKYILVHLSKTMATSTTSFNPIILYPSLNFILNLKHLRCFFWKVK